MEKIFVSTCISQKKDYCADRYFTHIRNLTYPNKKFYFVDNSSDPMYHIEIMNQYGVEVDYCSPKGLSNVMYHTKSMNQCLQKFMESDCDAWMMIEEDNFPPLDIIEQLLAHDKLIVAAPYFINTGKDSILLIGEMENTYGEQTNRFYTWKEDFKNFDGKLKSTEIVGHGCTLIKRIVLQDYSFYCNERAMAHADTMFSFDMHEQGIEMFVDNSIICEHQNQQWTLNKFA